MNDLLKEYPVIIDIPVAWGDMDAYQHVNNTIYFRYMETGRIAYFDLIEMPAIRKQYNVGTILHSTNCRFRIPLTFPDTVSVGTRAVDIQDDRFTFESTIVSLQHQKVAAYGAGIVVCYDYGAQRKTSMPQALREQIQRVENINTT